MQMVSGVQQARLCIGLFVGTTGTCHHDDKGEIQATEIASMRVPMRDTGAELFVVVKKSAIESGA